MSVNILVVDNENLTRRTLGLLLTDAGHSVRTAESGFRALEMLADEPADVVLTDLRMPSLDGHQLLALVLERWPATAVILMTAYGTVSNAVEAIQHGAADYLTKPIDNDDLLIRVERLASHRRIMDEIRRLRADVSRLRQGGPLVFRSKVMEQVVERALSVADTDVSVLIQGETGTGKQVVAELIHQHSLRSAGPIVTVTCSEMNPNLVESELFGHEAGAFTGASRRRKGRLETASGGTILLDEVDDLSREIQVRLLRFLQERAFERVGSSQTHHSDVRVLCATKRPLTELLKQGLLREDFYYRINTVVIELPPLRRRREDVVPLAQHFLSLWSQTTGRETAGLSDDALADLLNCDWPGNVRQLRHVVEHGAIFARGGVIRREHLPPGFVQAVGTPLFTLHASSVDEMCFRSVTSDFERSLFEWALDKSAGSQVDAARRLKIPRTTLRSHLAALKRHKAENGS